MTAVAPNRPPYFPTANAHAQVPVSALAPISTMMVPGATSGGGECAKVYHRFDRPLSPRGPLDHGHGGGYHHPRPAIEPLRPLEPRYTHHAPSSQSDHAGAPRPLPDPFRRPSTETTAAAAAAEPRSRGHSLPGLKDILSPESHASTQPPYGAPWTPTSGPPPSRHSSDGYGVRGGWHPPLALHPPTELGQPRYAPYPPHRRDPPVREPSPGAARPPPSSLPVSPYTPYPDARDRSESWSERAGTTTTSHTANGVAGLYGSEPDSLPVPQAATTHADPPPEPSALSKAHESQRKYLGVEDVPGEGTFHLYEGGFRIPTHVDGEHVNPAWGLTKANKPRKRLALACLDCREKKIKCEPGTKSCVQCDKAKRPCRRAPSHQPPNDATAVPVWHANSTSPGRNEFRDQTPASNRHSDAETWNKRRSRDEPSPPDVPTKKHRSASPLVSPSRATDAPIHMYGPTAPPATTHTKLGSPVSEHDRFSLDPDTTLHLLDLYFVNINSATYCLFPRNAFMHWAQAHTDKCQNETMVLNAMLAVGSIFADDRLSGVGKRCAESAKEMVSAKMGVLSLCTVQAQLLLGLYYLAKGSYGLAWDLSGSAIRTCANPELQLNEEVERDDPRWQASAKLPFALTREQLAECRRRTFWSCFLADRLEDGTLCMLAPQDIYLRLPCPEDAYERGLPSDAPFFNNGIVDPALTVLAPTSPVCPMAWLALVVARWAEVRSFTRRAVHHPPAAYRDAYESFYADTRSALEQLMSSLPGYMQYSTDNLARSIQGGYGGAFVAVHALYLFTLIRLNRVVRHALVPDHVSRNIRAAHYNAHSLLTMMSHLPQARRVAVGYTASRPHTGNVFSMPILGMTVLSAIDVVGAGGLDSHLGSALEVMGGGLRFLQELAQFWHSAREQLKVSEKRFYQIKNILVRPYKAQSGAWLGREWGMKDPLGRELGLAHDCIYGLEYDGRGDGYTRIYFDALREDTNENVSPLAGLHIA